MPGYLRDTDNDLGQRPLKPRGTLTVPLWRAAGIARCGMLFGPVPFVQPFCHSAPKKPGTRPARDRVPEHILRVMPVPLVIHGESDFLAYAVGLAIWHGLSKPNLGTQLKEAFLSAVPVAGASPSDPADPQLAVGSRKNEDILTFAKTRVRQEIVRFIALCGST